MTRPLTTDQLREQALAVWLDLEWRHHGTGMLQAYLPGRDDARIHIWHPILLLPGMTDSGGMHNHRFAFRSTVLCGSLAHSNLRVRPDPEGAYGEWQIDLASRSEDKDIRLIQRVDMQRQDDVVFQTGAIYSLAKWQYHHARPVNLGVTYVEISDKSQDKRASLLAPFGQKPVAAFGNPVHESIAVGFILAAHDMLGGRRRA